MNIEKRKDGRTYVRISANQSITYVVQTSTGDRNSATVIRSDILDALYNRAWDSES
jgi:c-di-GMP-binding flagellar brake protein YcgR